MRLVLCGWPALVGWRFLCVCAFDGFLLWLIAYACPATASLCNTWVPALVSAQLCMLNPRVFESNYSLPLWMQGMRMVTVIAHSWRHPRRAAYGLMQILHWQTEAPTRARCSQGACPTLSAHREQAQGSRCTTWDMVTPWAGLSAIFEVFSHGSLAHK